MHARRTSTAAILAMSLLLCASQLNAQAAPPATKAPPGAPSPMPMPGMGAPNQELAAKEAQVPPATPIITIDGFCQDAAAKPCQTQVSKADFEKLMKALDPNMQPQGRLSLADQYSKIAVMAAEAKKHNVENDPRSQEIMRFLQMQILANLYNQQIQDKAKDVPQADIEKYYNDHKNEFEEVTLRRIYIPRNVPADAKKLSDAERAALGNDIDKRAKAGEDFNALQKEVFDKLAIKSSPPPTDMGAQRRTSFSAEEGAVIFDLGAGQVSDIVATPIGDFVYKVVSKRTLSLDEAKTDILTNLQRQRYNTALGAIFAPVSVKLNTDYFGPNASVTMPGKNPEPQAPAAPSKPTKAPAPPAAKPPGN